jgi:CRISPR/Cas system CSM-associated protein Csm2 small subunit
MSEKRVMSESPSEIAARIARNKVELGRIKKALDQLDDDDPKRDFLENAKTVVETVIKYDRTSAKLLVN